MKARTTIEILDVKVQPSHVNRKGVQVEGLVMISIKVRYGKKYEWNKAYGFLPKDLKNFDLEDLKVRVYEESRTWIQEKDLQAVALKKLKATENETIYLD